MHVIHRKTVLEQIDDAIKSAAINGKDIERIVITPNEWERLREELRALRSGIGAFLPANRCIRVRNVVIEVEEEEF